MRGSYRSNAKNLCQILFHYEGNVLFAVLPYCIVNCGFLVGAEYVKHLVGFSPTGHGLLTLLISFLVVSKVNLAYERYKEARMCIGNAFSTLRELHQLAIVYSLSPKENVDKSNNDIDDDSVDTARKKAQQDEDVIRSDEWRSECLKYILQLLDCTTQAIQDENISYHLARNEELQHNQKNLNSNISNKQQLDPLVLVQTFRLHLYNAHPDLQLLERTSLNQKLSEYIHCYRKALELSSTPIPFPLVQMGRTFLFIWVFTMPLVLRQGPFNDIWSAMVFLFFLTYGFIGLELVSMKLSNPFGDEIHDIQITAMRDATIHGMERDLNLLTQSTRQPSGSNNMGNIGLRREYFRHQKRESSNTRNNSEGSNAFYYEMSTGDIDNP